MIEITCPCCERCRHATRENLRYLQKKQCVKGKEIVCSDCWRVFIGIVRRRREGKA